MAKTYDTYKDCSSSFIGKVPNHWEFGKFRYSGIFTKGKLPLTTNVEGVGKPIIGASEMLGKDNRLFTNSNDVPCCAKDDILILWDGANAGITSSNHEGVISSTTVKYHCTDTRINKRYLSFIFKMAENQFKEKVNGTTIPHMNMKFINEIPLLKPSIHEQQVIATYLDKKCGEIDSLISLQEEMISELQAYKQSVITEAVTKGLDPNVPMKDSGVEWIGEIPNGWKVMPIRSLFDKRNQKNNPIISKERLSLSIGVGITKYADKTTNLDRFKDDFTAYQLAYKDDIVLNSMNMIVGAVGKSDFMGCVSPVYYVVTAKQNVSPDFYAYSLNTTKIRDVYHSLGRGIYAIERGDGRVNTCRLKVPYYDFSIINMPVPPLSEQQVIASYLDEKISQIDALIAIKQEKITELKEYKKSIIYEYVTGKKKV